MKANIKLILVALAFLFISSIVSAAGPKSYGLYFPNPLLKSGERIDQIDISVSCGHIEAITHIPNDWNFEIIRAISAIEELHASAGHGGSMIEQIEELNGAIRVSIEDKNCFDISAKFLVHATGAEREIRFSRTQLRLLP
ncbi:MAG: hypothetical protein ACLPSL_11350 [Smithella sp.]